MPNEFADANGCPIYPGVSEGEKHMIYIPALHGKSLHLNLELAVDAVMPPTIAQLMYSSVPAWKLSKTKGASIRFHDGVRVA